MKKKLKTFLLVIIFSSISLGVFPWVNANDFSQDKQNHYPGTQNSPQQGGGGNSEQDWTYYAQQQGYLPSDGQSGGGDEGGQQGGNGGGTTGAGGTNTQKECKDGCCGIKLNTNFPIIGNCIETKGDKANPTNAFPYMVGALTKIIMSLIMVVCFILIIVAGIMWAGDKPKEGKDLLKKVAITILLLGFSGVILRLINPNFFS